jgi:uroporphyrinogen decarboxylase
MISTIFNAWAVLRHLIRPPTEHLPPVMDAAADGPSRRILQMHATGPDAVRAALATIADNLARFASRCIDAGADGIFLSVRDDWVDAPGSAPLYPHLVRPTDLAILAGASRATFNMLHVCGKAVDFAAMARYPVHAINWADRAAGPSIATAATFARPALCGGVDNLWTLPTGTPADVEREVADAMAQAGDRPLLIAPGCTYDPAKVPEANLGALAAKTGDGG